jgi:hypothetical protein
MVNRAPDENSVAWCPDAVAYSLQLLQVLLNFLFIKNFESFPLMDHTQPWMVFVVIGGRRGR